MKRKVVAIILSIGLAACETDQEKPFEKWQEKGEEFSGGAATIYDESENAFGQLAPNITGDKEIDFVVGNSFFRRNWVTAPASTDGLDGLGPLFNARSCGACHFKDGRGAPPLTADENPVALLFRLSRPAEIEWETIDDDYYGGQFNHFAIIGVESEGDVSVSYIEEPGQYPDGTAYSLRKPVYTFSNLKYGEFAPDMMISPRIAPHMVGLGLLEALSEETILSNTDPDDLDGDGISGRANYVWDIERQKDMLGRFGWKANQPNVKQQVAGAFNGDIGITSSLFPNQPCATEQGDCAQAIDGGSPELSDEILDQVALYSSTLAVPKRRNWEDKEVLQGKALFNKTGCTGCHIPKFITNSHETLPEFNNQPIYPYTDLLLHDMGEGLADHRPDRLASGTEWKTPPLWGLGLIQVVNDHTFLLHDGRARNVEEAILWHAGEAEQIKQNFMALEQEERAALIAFIKSL